MVPACDGPAGALGTIVGRPGRTRRLESIALAGRSNAACEDEQVVSPPGGVAAWDWGRSRMIESRVTSRSTCRAPSVAYTVRSITTLGIVVDVNIPSMAPRTSRRPRLSDSMRLSSMMTFRFACCTIAGTSETGRNGTLSSALRGPVTAG